jgi:hypothetical protein
MSIIHWEKRCNNYISSNRNFFLWNQETYRPLDQTDSKSGDFVQKLDTYNHCVTTLGLEMIRSSETLVKTYKTTRCQKPEASIDILWKLVISCPPPFSSTTVQSTCLLLLRKSCCIGKHIISATQLQTILSISISVSTIEWNEALIMKVNESKQATMYKWHSNRSLKNNLRWGSILKIQKKERK